MNLSSIALIAGAIVLALVVIGVVMTTLYKRSTRDQAYVRTGLGGKKVVLDGGALILPIFHSYSWVSLSTLRLEVKRAENESLITKDRMRADITAEFYVRVKPDAENISLAAQTLGDRTNDADALKALVEAKFVDGLRSVAATMTLPELQEQRADFVKSVQQAVAHDLQSNGLELESVSLTRLDQTDIKHFNPNNTFDAEGLTALTRITETRRRERNDIVRETEVTIAEKDRETTLKQLEISRGEREAKLSQERDIANKTAETRAEAAKAEQAARLSEESSRVDTERGIAEREAEARKARESARIDADIAVAQKSEQEQAARAKAEEARATAVKAEESVATTRAVEIASRAKQIAVIEAQQAAEQDATRITVMATADKEAAANRAEAVLTEARAEAEASEIRAKGVIAIGEAEARAETAKNAARNTIGPNVVDFELAKERLRIVPLALEQAMKPIEKIGSIQIFDAGRMLGAVPGGGSSQGNAVAGLSDQLLSYRGQAPVVDAILEQAGFKGRNPVEALLGGVAAPASEPAKTAAAGDATAA